MWTNALHRIGVEHLPKHLFEAITEGDSAVVLLTEKSIEVVNDVQLAV